MTPLEDWSYEDFLTLLFLTGAKADLDISEEEKEEIIRKVGEVEYQKVKRHFDQQNDAQHIETIIGLYKKFESRIGGKENLVKAVREVVSADARHVHIMDEYLMMMLKRIL